MDAQTSEKKIRKTVGRSLEELSVFDRIRQLQASLEKMGLQPKQENDGEYLRRVVGAAHKEQH